jgi:hypothetical protein
MPPTPNAPATTVRIGDAVFTIDTTTIAAAQDHSTAWRPAGSHLAGLVAGTVIGMADDTVSDDVASKVQSISALSYLARRALLGGHRSAAILDSALMVVAVEQLAAAGSEDAAAAMQIVADRLRLDGIADEAFAMARTMLKGAA